MTKPFVVLLTLLFSIQISAQTSIYNVMDYGAKGDGRHDDASAIQLAIDRCSESGGGKVYLGQ